MYVYIYIYVYIYVCVCVCVFVCVVLCVCMAEWRCVYWCLLEAALTITPTAEVALALVSCADACWPMLHMMLAAAARACGLRGSRYRKPACASSNVTGRVRLARFQSTAGVVLAYVACGLEVNPRLSIMVHGSQTQLAAGRSRSAQRARASIPTLLVATETLTPQPPRQRAI